MFTQRERERERSISVKGEAISYQEFPFKASAIWFFKRVNFSSLIFISLSLEVVISNIFSSSWNSNIHMYIHPFNCRNLLLFLIHF